MTTKLISLNEYRKNLSHLWKEAQEKNIKYIIMVHSKPAFEVTPLLSNEFEDDWTEYTPKNHKAWLKAKQELKN